MEETLPRTRTRRTGNPPPGQPPSKLTVRLRAKILNAPAASLATVRPTGPAANSAKNSASAKTWFIVFGGKPTSSRIGWSATWPPTTPTSSAKPPTSSVSTSIRRAMPPCFAWMRRTAIQALDRRDRVLPLSPGRAERHGFEYKRNGTLSLYAALNTKTGQVHGKTAARHTSQDFVEFLGEVVARRAGPGDSHHPRQPLGPQDQAGGGVPRAAPRRRLTLHADLLVVAEPSRVVVFAATDVIARGSSPPPDLARKSALHQRLLERRQAFPLEVSKPSRRIRHGKTISATVH